MEVLVHRMHEVDALQSLEHYVPYLQFAQPGPAVLYELVNIHVHVLKHKV